MGTIRQTVAQSITVDFLVMEELDGETLAPEVIIDSTDPDRTAFDPNTQIFQPPAVPRLGLIDPDLLVGGSIGARCVPFLSIDTTATGDAEASADIVGVREAGEPDVFLQRQVADFSGLPGPLFVEDGFNVPQGSDLRLSGFAAPAGSPIRVRLTIMVPTTCQDLAAFRCGCEGAEGCCAPSLGLLPFVDTGVQVAPGWGVWQADGGDSPIRGLIYEGDPDSTVPLLLSIDDIDVNRPPSVEVVRDPLWPLVSDPPTAQVTNVTAGVDGSPDLLELEFDFSGDPDGVYWVRLTNPCGCSTGFALRVTIP